MTKATKPSALALRIAQAIEDHPNNVESGGHINIYTDEIPPAIDAELAPIVEALERTKNALGDAIDLGMVPDSDEATGAWDDAAQALATLKGGDA